MLQWRQIIIFRETLKFINKKEMNDFIQNLRFWFYFKFYAKTWIWLYQKNENKSNTKRDRESDLKIVQRWLVEDEVESLNKYSNLFSNIKDWSVVNYLIQLFYRIRDANIRNFENLFYEKKFSEIELNNRV